MFLRILSFLNAGLVVILAVVIVPTTLILGLLLLIIMLPIAVVTESFHVIHLLRKSRKMAMPSWVINENHKLAKKFSEPGTVKNFALRLGFMPNDEKDAEEILKSVIEECEMYKSKYELLKSYGIS